MGREGVPVFDMQKTEGLGEEIVKACEEWGCFRMVNHGVPIELMAEMKVVITSLFDLPTEIKMRTANSEYGKGYIGCNPTTPILESFSLDDISSPREFCDHLEVSLHEREVIYKYLKATSNLVGLIGLKLNQHSGLRGDLFEKWNCRLRMNKYHYSSETVGSPGVFVHSDPSFITILQDDQDVNGLQVVDKYSGDFIPLDPIPGTLLGNIGSFGKEWSNGKYYDVEHRVWCFEAKTRYSLAFFVEGPNDKKVEAPSDSEHTHLDQMSETLNSTIPIDDGLDMNVAA